MWSSMKVASWAFVVFGMLAAPAPLRGEDLSSYRSFRIGTNLATVAEQVHMDPTKAQIVYERPALIQQFTWWPDNSIDSISAAYGTPTRPATSIRTGSPVLYGFGDEEKVIARWQNLHSSVNLIRSSYDELYGLILVSKRVDGLAQEAMIEGARLDVVERPQKEIDRKKHEAEVERADAEKARVVNLPAFRP
jgi:hypothetical protein